MQRLSLWGGEAVRELDCSGNSEQRVWLVLNPPTSPAHQQRCWGCPSCSAAQTAAS